MISYSLIALMAVPAVHGHVQEPVRVTLQAGIFKDQCERAKLGYRHRLEVIRKKTGQTVTVICEVDGVYE